MWTFAEGTIPTPTLLTLSCMKRRKRFIPSALIIFRNRCLWTLSCLLLFLTFYVAGWQHLLMGDFENEASLAPNVESLMKGTSSRLRRLQVKQDIALRPLDCQNR